MDTYILHIYYIYCLLEEESGASSLTCAENPLKKAYQKCTSVKAKFL